MPDLSWKLLSSSYIHKGPWATLRVDKCEMPDGKVVDDYYVLEYPNWVNAVAITEQNEVLMVRQYRHAANIISLEIPGGVIDGDELPENAIKRELLEETGYSFSSWKLLCILFANPSTANNRTYCYLAQGGKKIQDQHFDEHEDLIVERYSIPELKQLLIDKKIGQALHCAGIFYALMELQKL